MGQHFMQLLFLLLASSFKLVVLLLDIAAEGLKGTNFSLRERQLLLHILCVGLLESEPILQIKNELLFVEDLSVQLVVPVLRKDCLLSNILVLQLGLILYSLKFVDVGGPFTLCLLLKHDLSAVLKLAPHIIFLFRDSLEQMLVLLKLSQLGGLPFESLLLERVVVLIARHHR